MNWLQAVEQMEQGYKVRLSKWKEGVYLQLSEGGAVVTEKGVNMRLHYSLFKALDWEVVKDKCPKCKSKSFTRDRDGKCSCNSCGAIF